MPYISQRKPVTPQPRLAHAMIVTLFMMAAVSASPALADETTAQAALSRAEAKIEMATRQAGEAGDTGDQSFNTAREKRDTARAALSAGHYDAAEMAAEEAGIMAELTSERAKLVALKTSYDAVAKTASPSDIHP